MSLKTPGYDTPGRVSWLNGSRQDAVGLINVAERMGQQVITAAYTQYVVCADKDVDASALCDRDPA